MERPERMEKGLVLEGGAMRGLFTAGILDLFLEHGIHFGAAVGVSAGAVFGCNFKSRQIGRVLRYNSRFCRNWRYCGFRSLFLTGDLYGAEFCYRELPEKLDPFDESAFWENPMEFHLVCTDAESGEPVYHLCRERGRELLDWFRATASMPLVSRPVPISGRLLLDGGISDSIPLQYLENRGFLSNVVILTQPKGYRKKKMRFLPIFRFLNRRYPRIAEQLAVRHEKYNAQIEYLEKQEKAGKALVIRPPAPLEIGHVERDARKMRKVYEIGRAEGERRLGEILEFCR